MIIYLFRHGETNFNKERRLQGQIDIPLNEYGRELAKETAAALGNISWDRAFSSPLKRALETAEMILKGRDILPETDSRLREMGFGDYEGSDFDLPKKDSGHRLHDFLCAPHRYVPPAGGESFQEVTERGWEFFQEKILPLEGECKNVLILAHGAFNRCILGRIGGKALEEFWNISLPNCAASILSLENGVFRIVEESRIYYENPVNGRP